MFSADGQVAKFKARAVADGGALADIEDNEYTSAVMNLSSVFSGSPQDVEAALTSLSCYNQHFEMPQWEGAPRLLAYVKERDQLNGQYLQAGNMQPLYYSVPNAGDDAENCKSKGTVTSEGNVFVELD